MPALRLQPRGRESEASNGWGPTEALWALRRLPVQGELRAVPPELQRREPIAAGNTAARAATNTTIKRWDVPEKRSERRI